MRVKKREKSSKSKKMNIVTNINKPRKIDVVLSTGQVTIQSLVLSKYIVLTSLI
jgi:hypothetical protein